MSVYIMFPAVPPYHVPCAKSWIAIIFPDKVHHGGQGIIRILFRNKNENNGTNKCPLKCLGGVIVICVHCGPAEVSRVTFIWGIAFLSQWEWFDPGDDGKSVIIKDEWEILVTQILELVTPGPGRGWDQVTGVSYVDSWYLDTAGLAAEDHNLLPTADVYQQFCGQLQLQEGSRMRRGPTPDGCER